MSLINIILTIFVFFLVACSGPMPMQHSQKFAPIIPMERDVGRLPTGAIFAEENTDMWQAKKRHYRVGDIVTVLLDEATQAERSLDNETSRTSTNDVIPAGLAERISGLNPILNGLKADGSTITNTGTGNVDQSATLTGSIAVTISEVQANGNLVIRGEKQLSLSEGGEVIQVSGIIRPQDISAINTVQSRRLANAQITYKGSGDLVNATRPGWGTSALFKFWPF